MSVHLIYLGFQSPPDVQYDNSNFTKVRCKSLVTHHIASLQMIFVRGYGFS
jgi:hypothetical protein